MAAHLLEQICNYSPDVSFGHFLLGNALEGVRHLLRVLPVCLLRATLCLPSVGQGYARIPEFRAIFSSQGSHNWQSVWQSRSNISSTLMHDLQRHMIYTREWMSPWVQIPPL